MAEGRPLPRFQARRQLGRTGCRATAVGIGDLADRSVPLAQCVATLHRAMEVRASGQGALPGHLSTHVALMGMRFPNEQDAALHAAAAFQPLTAEQLVDVRRRAVEAIEGKGAVWWNPGA